MAEQFASANFVFLAAHDAQLVRLGALAEKEFAKAYGEVEDAAIRKITGSVDRPGSLILSFRNDALPKIAVTVDLLTTGIDVPSIENLVFLRRVNSRILYEQMLGGQPANTRRSAKRLSAFSTQSISTPICRTSPR